jgi:histidine triad (HIT) family protein
VTDDCLFCKIVAGSIPATIVYETPTTLAFRDIAPKAPVHVLVIPKDHYADLAALTAAQPGLTGDLFAAVAEVGAQEGLADSGFRTIVNSGPDSGMEVAHVHAHVLGGEPLGAMLAR